LRTTASFLQCFYVNGEYRMLLAGGTTCFSNWWQVCAFLFLIPLSAYPVGLFFLSLTSPVSKRNRANNEGSPEGSREVSRSAVGSHIEVFRPEFGRKPNSSPASQPSSPRSQSPPPPFSLASQPRPQILSFGEQLLLLIEGPYVARWAFWESVKIFQRFVLVLIYTFAQDQFYKSALLALVLIVSLSLEAALCPYGDQVDNFVSLFLNLCLVTIAVFEIQTAVVMSLITDSINASIQATLIWIYFAILLLVCLVVVGRFLNLLTKSIRRHPKMKISSF